MNMHDGRSITLDHGSFNSSVKENDIFVYCASSRLSADLAHRFGSFCVEIPESGTLVRRLRMRAHPASQFDYEQLVYGKVDYRDPTQEPKVDWALPEKLVLIKHKEFAWQDEFRIAIGKRDAMNVENVSLTIQTGPVVASAEPAPSPIFLRLKKLSDAILHRF